MNTPPHPPHGPSQANPPRQAPHQADALFSLDLPPQSVRPAGRDELARLELEWQEASSHLGLAAEDLTSEGVKVPARWRGALLALGTLISGLALLILFSQAATLLDQVSTLPLWPRRLAMGALALIVLAVLLSLLRLAWVFIKLGRTPRISTRALRELAQRAEMRTLALERSGAARKQLERLLASYPLGRAKDRVRLSRLGVTPAEVDRLEHAAKLLRTQESGGDGAWLDQFDRLFLSVLDEAARRRSNRYALMVGIKTAAVPGGAFDAAIVMINAYLLIGDLCLLYNVRTGPWGTATILVQVLVSALAASQIEDVTSATADHLTGQISQHLGGIAAGLTQVAGRVAARVGDGAVNGVLTRRLGIVAIRQLRPIAEHG
ncbi:MAG: YcjF family protein [Phycisphaerales bacterium]|nr:YcjF family protein [Phycisphaerales bacterium]